MFFQFLPAFRVIMPLKIGVLLVMCYFSPLVASIGYHQVLENVVVHNNNLTVSTKEYDPPHTNELINNITWSYYVNSTIFVRYHAELCDRKINSTCIDISRAQYGIDVVTFGGKSAGIPFYMNFRFITDYSCSHIKFYNIEIKVNYGK